MSFLHAYSAIGFRLEAEGRHPTSSLSSEIFDPVAKGYETCFYIPELNTILLIKPFCSVPDIIRKMRKLIELILIVIIIFPLSEIKL
jgi:hypothetical protein